MTLTPPPHITGNLYRWHDRRAERVAWITEAIANGATAENIAAALGLSMQRVYDIASRAGVSLRQPKTAQQAARGSFSVGGIGKALKGLTEPAFTDLLREADNGKTAAEVLAEFWEQHHGGEK